MITPNKIRQTFQGMDRASLSVRSDYDLNPDARPMAEGRGQGHTLRKAAVLLPIIDRQDGVHILFTKRTAHLNNHAGQISFPGGGLEPQDRDHVDAALRETEEEIGITKNHVEIIGQLDTYETGTNFSITPVVGLVSPRFSLQINPDEVEHVFEVPLAYLMDAKNHKQQSGIYKNIRRYYYAISYQDYTIWGATASIFMNFYDVLKSHDATEKWEVF